MAKNQKLPARFKNYLNWPFLLTIIPVAMAVSVFFWDVGAGICAACMAAVYIGISLYLYHYYRSGLMQDINAFGADYAQIQKQLLNELSLPFGMCDETGRLLWMNNEMIDMLGPLDREATLFERLPGFGKHCFPGTEDEKVSRIAREDRYFQIHLKRVLMTDTVKNLSVPNPGSDELFLYAVYLMDETENVISRKELEENRLVCGLLYMDNYEEAQQSLEEVRKSLLIALVDRKITQYFKKYNGILKKLEKDKYLFVIAARYLPMMRENRFSILEEAKAVNIGNDMAMTISIGIGVGGQSFETCYEFAKNAIDLALGRGGDQAVIKDEKDVEYYGGKTHSLEKNTRVKARVKAHALRELIESKERILIMGHSLSDIDAIGAAIGIFKAVQASGKTGNIVLEDLISSVAPVVERFKASSDYPEDMFVDREKALSLLDDNTIVVVVDVNRLSFTECPEVVKKARQVIIIDHHRQSNENMENVVLSYIEPFASSAVEMVAEILQYYKEGLKLKALEADAMYAGIMIDTNNFLNNTGVRTFEAAAYLRRSGADITRVRKLFRENQTDYLVRARAITEAEIFENRFAISICSGKTVESLNVVAAQAANELLNIQGISASFVLADMGGKIYISARSIDEINVQLVMERLGGGGHMTVAGAQISDKTVEEAKEMLKETILVMRQEDIL